MTRVANFESGSHTIADDKFESIFASGDELGQKSALQWRLTVPPERRYALKAIVEEDDGIYVAHVAELPGVVTQAETLQDLVLRLNEAASGAIECYLASGEDIPWADREVVDAAVNSAERCIAISVNVDG